MRTVTLGEVCKVVSGSTPKREKAEYWGGNIPWVTPKEINRLSSPYLWESEEKITQEGLDSCSTSMLPVGSVLLSSRAPIGLLAINKIPVCTNQGFKSLVPNEEVNAEYLYYVLKANVKSLQAKGNGATFKELAKPAVADFEIPLPPLNDQIRIAHLLGKVEGLIAQRKQHLQQLDDLLKSVFLKMFGFHDDTFTRWTIDRLTLHTEVVSGVTKGKKYTAKQLIEVPYMRVANVQDGHFMLDEVKKIAVSQKEIEQYQLRQGDLLLTEGGDPDKLGRGSVWEEQIPNCIHQNHIFRVRINNPEHINPFYLSALIGSRYGKSYFLKSAKQTTGIASINSTQLKNFPTLIPPIKLQNQFAAIQKKIDDIKSRYHQSLTELESLYSVLSQQAFKGELDLSRVQIPTEIAEKSIVEIFPGRQQEASEANSFNEYANISNLINQVSITPPSSLIDKQGNTEAWLEAYIQYVKDNRKNLDIKLFLQVCSEKWHEQYQFGSGGITEQLYEKTKERLFEQLRNTKLLQEYDEENIAVKLRLATQGN